MSFELFLILIGACGAYWYYRRRHPARQSLEPLPKDEQSNFAEDSKPPTNDDQFLNEVAATKRQSDTQVDIATREHEREMDARFSDDLKIKERLSQFAKQHELDNALIALWKEIEHYPAWSKREDFEEWNKLKLAGIDGSRDGEVETVSFSDAGHQYAISRKTWHGMEGDTYADFSFLEDGAEVFAIGCSVDYGEYDTGYSCHSISAFKKRGNWAKVLLHLYSRIQIEHNKTSSDMRYFRADEIKTRFEE